MSLNIDNHVRTYVYFGNFKLSYDCIVNFNVRRKNDCESCVQCLRLIIDNKIIKPMKFYLCAIFSNMSIILSFFLFIQSRLIQFTRTHLNSITGYSNTRIRLAFIFFATKFKESFLLNRIAQMIHSRCGMTHFYCETSLCNWLLQYISETVMWNYKTGSSSLLSFL